MTTESTRALAAEDLEWLRRKFETEDQRNFSNGPLAFARNQADRHDRVLAAFRPMQDVAGNEEGLLVAAADVSELVAALRSEKHRQPISPKAVYRTRDVTLFEEAADVIECLTSFQSRQGGK